MKNQMFLFAIMTFVLCSYGSHTYAGPYTEGLVGYWNFETGGTDLSSNNNTGSLNGSAQYSTDQDSLGQSLYLSGGYFSAPFHEDYNFTDSYSIVLWFKEESTSLATLISRWQYGTSERSYQIQTNWAGSNTITNLFSSNGSTHFSQSSGAIINFNEWYQVAVTYDGTHMKLFIDGTLIDEYSYSGAIKTSSAPLLLGANSTTNSLYRFTGYIDEVEMFNIALTDEQVMNDYLYVLTGELPAQPIPEPASIILVGIAVFSKLIIKRLG